MISRTEVIAEARRWIGTPYQHQARCLGAGVDCGGLVLEVARALDVFHAEYSDYGQLPHKGLIRALCDRHLERIDEAEPGCVLLIAFLPGPGQEQHLAIMTDTGTIVHAYANVGACVEHRYSKAWQARVRQFYRYPGVV
jgi:NlpC/P60 family putative phage cell wall peptidase